MVWNFFILQISNKCLPSIFKLEHLEDLILEGCFAITDDSLASVKHGCKSLKVFASGLLELFI